MRKSVLLASLIAAAALTACGKKEEPAPAVVTPPPAAVTPAPAPAACTGCRARRVGCRAVSGARLPRSMRPMPRTEARQEGRSPKQ